MSRSEAECLSAVEKYGGHSPGIFSLVPHGSRVLDVGCSTGALAAHLGEEKDCYVTGVDIDKESLREAARYCERVFECDLDNAELLSKLLRGERFDVITLGDVLEHLKHPSDILRVLRQNLTDNGIAIASIPNAAFIWLRLRFLLGDFSYSEEGGLMDESHLRFFDFKTARLLFEKSDYKVLRVYGVSTVRKRFWFLVPLAKMLPSLFALHIIVVAEKT